MTYSPVQVGADPDYLITEEIAQRYRTTVETVKYWRQISYGPQGVRIGRRVLYPRAEVERFDREIAAKQAAS